MGGLDPEMSGRANRRRDRATPLGVWARRNVWLLLVLPALLTIAVVFVVPLVSLLLRSVFDPDPTVRHFQTIAETGAYVRVLINTLRIAGVLTLLSLLLGFPVAHVMANGRGWLVTALWIGVALPLFTSDLVRVYAWQLILGRKGPLNDLIVWIGLSERPVRLLFTEGALLVGSLHILLPFTVLPLYSVMKAYDRRLTRAAHSLGASPLRSFVQVYLPLIMPGVTAAALLIFVLATGLYLTPAALGGKDNAMIAMLIELQGRQGLNWGLSSALAVVLLVATLIILAVYGRLVAVRRMPVEEA